MVFTFYYFFFCEKNSIKCNAAQILSEKFIATGFLLFCFFCRDSELGNTSSLSTVEEIREGKVKASFTFDLRSVFVGSLPCSDSCFLLIIHFPTPLKFKFFSITIALRNDSVN